MTDEDRFAKGVRICHVFAAQAMQRAQQALFSLEHWHPRNPAERAQKAATAILLTALFDQGNELMDKMQKVLRDEPPSGWQPPPLAPTAPIPGVNEALLRRLSNAHRYSISYQRAGSSGDNLDDSWGHDPD